MVAHGRAQSVLFEAERRSSISSVPSPQTNPNLPGKKRTPRWSDVWLKDTKSLENVIVAMQLQSSCKDSQIPTPNSKINPVVIANFCKIDRTLLLSDELLLKILTKLPDSQRNSNFLVCKRWLNLQGRIVRSLRVMDLNFLLSGRLILRFPNLNRVDLVSGSLMCSRNSGILLSNRIHSMHVDSWFLPIPGVGEENILDNMVIDRGLKALADGCPNLRKLAFIGGSELGLLNVAEECETLQELELHKCNDNLLRGIAACENLQILKLVGNVDGLYSSVVTDVGLTILAQGCKRLVKLELNGCEGSFDGIKAIGQCCQMLEELTICDHRMDNGWLAGLSYSENLKTLRIVSCRRIDPNPGPDEYLSPCPALERLHLQNCQLRDKKSAKALFITCSAAREIFIGDCWGLADDLFSFASHCWRVKFLSLKGCSLLTTEGLESVILQWKELQSLRVVSCKNIKESSISPALSSLFSIFKDLKWRPDTKSLLPSTLIHTHMGKKGGRFFKKTWDIKVLPGVHGHSSTRKTT
ncbi:F-box protein At5g51370-like [Cucurbita pepo subsp. pepo]|uniref:F-box protein At5g51370-like n=1 Tax=Cucurbita pepo subsp. pepo TaxID=3664 RepID=UPI000C9DA536|nr:F-box protein At5g51370-like [Cucurbita pepo subsp. pepo]